MKTIKAKIKDIKVNTNNPRFIKDDKFNKLVKSIKELPQMLEIRPIVVNDDMVVLGGNMRLRACQKAGLKEVPIIKASDLTEEQQQEFIIKDNVGFGSWDWDILANEWDTEQLEDWGLEMPFDLETEEAEEDNYQIPDEINTDIVLGDLIEIGEHRLLCGDSTDSEQVAKLMDGDKADMVFTDPPYGLGGYGGRKNMELKNDDGSDSLITLFYNLPIYEKIDEVYIWGNHINLFKHLQKEPKDTIVWKKNNFGLGRGYRGQYELCFYYGKFKGSDSDVWEVNKDTNYKHPTQKPIDLCVRAIKNSKPNLLLDLFLGSGSTMVAAHQLKRKCYGMELDNKYCQVIIDRMLKLDETLEVKVNGKPYKVKELQHG